MTLKLWEAGIGSDQGYLYSSGCHPKDPGLAFPGPLTTP